MVVENKQFQREFMCYSMNFLELQDSKKNATQLNKTDKIIMPESILDHLSRYPKIECPYTFKLSNKKSKREVYCGVLEFTSNDPHIIYVPRWLMLNLGVEDGERVNVDSVTLEKGEFIKLRPQSELFFKLKNPKRLLERHLTNFTTMFQGEIISINYLGKRFDIDVLETKPDKAINVVNTNINLEFVNMFLEEEDEEKDVPKDATTGTDNNKDQGYWSNMNGGRKIG